MKIAKSLLKIKVAIFFPLKVKKNRSAVSRSQFANLGVSLAVDHRKLLSLAMKI